MVEVMTKGVLEWSRAGDQIDSKLGENDKKKTREIELLKAYA